MLTKVEVRNDQGVMLSLPLQDISSGFVIENIEGLDPVKATIVSSSFANKDGTQYESSRREARNLVLTIGLAPNYALTSVSALRNALYEFFMPKSAITLRFFIDGILKGELAGRVESFESSIFSKEPTVDVSVICFNPDIKALTSVSVAGNTTAASDEITINYTGSVETGAVFTLNVDRVLPTFSIYHRRPNNAIGIFEFAYALVAGDVVKISTVPGDKYATLTRGGVDSSILYGASPYSNWFELEPGSNYIRVYAEGIAIPYTIAYTNKYGGL